MKLSKKKMTIIVTAVIVVALIAVMFILYFATDMFKTPKQLFFKYLGKEMDFDGYEQVLKGLETDKNKSYVSNANLKVNVESIDNEEIYDTINKMELNLEQSVNAKENKECDKLNLKYDNNDFAGLEFVQNEDLYALKSEYLNGDNYVAIENKDLKNFLRKMEVNDDIIENFPDQITKLDLYELLYIDKKDQKEIVKTYKKFIDENISNDKFKVNNKVDITINGENKKATQYILTLNEKEVANIAINFMNTLKQDDTTLDLIVDKYNKCMENTISGISMYQTKSQLSSYGLSSEDEEKTLTKEKLKEDIDKIVKEIEDERENSKEDLNINISLYKINGKICTIEMTKEDESIKIDEYEKDDRNYIEMSISHNEYSYARGKKQETKVEDKVVIDYIMKTQNDETNLEGNIKVLEDSEEQENFKFNINQKGKMYNGNNETNIEISSTIEENTIKINLNSKKEYKDVDIITLSDNKDNIKILNEMQKEEVTKLFEEISKNFQTKLNEKISELGLKNSSLTSDIENELEDDLDIETDIEDEDNLDTGDKEDDSEEYVDDEDDEEDLSVDSEMNEGFTF